MRKDQNIAKGPPESYHGRHDIKERQWTVQEVEERAGAEKGAVEAERRRGRRH
jgi:hypothetical protein